MTQTIATGLRESGSDSRGPRRNSIPTGTVERFLAMARDAILANADLKPDERAHLETVKVTYGAGNGTYRGITYFSAWQPVHGFVNGAANGKAVRNRDAATDEHSTTDFIEIAATAQESWVQLAGTLLHELGHSLAGMGVGHGKEWKAQCVRLGFVKDPAAAGQRYWLSLFRPELRRELYVIAKSLRDGNPAFWAGQGSAPTTVRPCRAGQGTRGGKSRGTGSGSRLRLWECGCDKPIKVRVASDDFQAHCDVCGQPFARK